MKIKIFIIDAFTNEAFKGNPAGVCLLDNPIEPKLMQAIASEINLSETAFLTDFNTDKSTCSIQYFSPTVEVPFCGHATLAAAKLILHKIGKPKILFKTHHDLEIEASSSCDFISMQFPLYDTIDYLPQPMIYEALGIDEPIAVRFNADLNMLLIEVEEKNTLLNIQPDYQKLLESSTVIKEVVVTVRSEDEKYDFYSRCFCPWLGINEDPVTGAVHAVLAKYWQSILGKTTLQAYQASKRGGFMQLNIVDSQTLEVKSYAKIVFEGEMNV